MRNGIILLLLAFFAYSSANLYCQPVGPPETSYGNNNITYTVKQGDTLYSIAKKFNVTVDSIQKENKISSNNIDIGKVIIIPNKPFGQPLVENPNVEFMNETVIESGTYFPYYSIKLNADGSDIEKSFSNVPNYVVNARPDKGTKKIQFSFFEKNAKIKDESFTFSRDDVYILTDSSTGEKVRIRPFQNSYILVEFFSATLEYLGGVVMVKSSSS